MDNVVNISNQILGGLSKLDRTLIYRSLEVATLTVRQILEAPYNAIPHVYFVESGLVSVVGTSPKHRIEVGMVGYEGMTGLSVVLGDDRSANETMVQSTGTALRIPSAALRTVMRSSPTLTASLLRYANVFMVQSTQTALANGRGKLAERLARWLLMWRDRLQNDNLTITHEFLSVLLGVRRPGITIIVNELEGRGLIKATRTLIRIVNREGLMQAANGFYGVPEEEYRRQMSPTLISVDVPEWVS